ncbi:hypothetical protein BZK24_08490, partial [Helicobacter pylori]
HLKTKPVEYQMYLVFANKNDATNDTTALWKGKHNILLGKDRLTKVWVLRNVMQQMDDIEALSFVYSKMQQTKDNEEFLNLMNEK